MNTCIACQWTKEEISPVVSPTSPRQERRPDLRHIHSNRQSLENIERRQAKIRVWCRTSQCETSRGARCCDMEKCPPLRPEDWWWSPLPDLSVWRTVLAGAGGGGGVEGDWGAWRSCWLWHLFSQHTGVSLVYCLMQYYLALWTSTLQHYKFIFSSRWATRSINTFMRMKSTELLRRDLSSLGWL